LTAKLDKHAFRLFLIVNIEHVLEGKRLKIKFVARVVIGGNRFRIRVHHDRLESELAQSERGVHAAVVEFNTLADPVWAAAQDHNLAFAALAPLVLIAVRRIVVRGVRFKLRRAGIHEAVRRCNA
jgi:hypothetical protein